MHVPVLFLGVIFSCTGSNSAADGGSALLVYFRVKINIPFARLSAVVKSSFQYVSRASCSAPRVLRWRAQFLWMITGTKLFSPCSRPWHRVLPSVTEGAVFDVEFNTRARTDA